MRDLSKLQQAVDWLRVNPVPNLDMASWCREESCGTTHCIAGWLAENKKFDLEQSGSVRLAYNRYSQGYDALKQTFNLNEMEAEDLFSPDSEGLQNDWEYALHKLERFLNVGHYFIEGSNFQLLNSGFHHNINLRAMQDALRGLPSETACVKSRLFEFKPTGRFMRITQRHEGTAYFKIHRDRIYFVQGDCEFELEERGPEY